MATLNEHGFSMEDAGGLSGFGVQDQISLRLGLAPAHQSSETLMSLATLGIFAAQQRDAIQFAWAITAASLLKPDSAVQSFTAAVDALVDEVEDQFLTSLTKDDYERLVASLDKLSDVVGENKHHLFAPFMDFIRNLIEKYGEESNMKKEHRTALDADFRLPAHGLELAYGDDEPEYTLDMLISVNPDYAGLDENGEVSLPLPARGLELAYGDDEPEYTLDMLIAVNPEYEDASEKWGYELPLPDSNSQETGNDADSEYTLDMLIEVNPDYEDDSEKWQYK